MLEQDRFGIGQQAVSERVVGPGLGDDPAPLFVRNPLLCNHDVPLSSKGLTRNDRPCSLRGRSIPLASCNTKHDADRYRRQALLSESVSEGLCRVLCEHRSGLPCPIRCSQNTVRDRRRASGTDSQTVRPWMLPSGRKIATTQACQQGSATWVVSPLSRGLSTRKSNSIRRISHHITARDRWAACAEKSPAGLGARRLRIPRYRSFRFRRRDSTLHNGGGCESCFPQTQELRGGS